MAKRMVMLDPSVRDRPAMIMLAAKGKHRAMLVHMLGLVYTTEYQSEGWIPKKALPLLYGRKSDAAALVADGLWFEGENGWGIYEWMDNRILRPRVALSKAKRRTVFERDNYKCRNCRSTENLSVDHIEPWSLGGSNDLDNLQTLCLRCNASKGAR